MGVGVGVRVGTEWERKLETETEPKRNRMRIEKCTTKDGIIIKNLRCVKNIKRKFICAKFVDFTLIFARCVAVPSPCGNNVVGKYRCAPNEWMLGKLWVQPFRRGLTQKSLPFIGLR